MKKESNTIVLNTTKKTRRRNNTTHYERLIALLQLIWEGKGHKRTHLARSLVLYEYKCCSSKLGKDTGINK